MIPTPYCELKIKTAANIAADCFLKEKQNDNFQPIVPKIDRFSNERMINIRAKL